MKTAFIYSDRFREFDYGENHPLKTFRLELTVDLIKSYGLLSLPGSDPSGDILRVDRFFLLTRLVSPDFCLDYTQSRLMVY